MSSYKGSVSYSPLRSALVNLPPSVTGVLFNSNIAAQNVVLELVWQGRQNIKGERPERHAYVGWTGMSSKVEPGRNDLVEIDPTFALSLGLESGQAVSIKIHGSNVQSAHTVHLEPMTASDWEIVEIHAQFLESWMINQVRAVSTVHPITVYPSSTSIATLKVTRIEPDPGPGGFAMLAPDSEVVIAPKVRKKKQAEAPSQLNSDTQQTNGAKKSRKKKLTDRFGPCILLRGVAMPHEAFSGVDQDTLAVEAYADPNSTMFALKAAEYVTVSIIKPSSLNESSQPPAPGGGDHEGEEMTAINTVVAKLVPYVNAPRDHVGLSYSLSAALGIANTLGNLVRLEPAPRPASKISGLRIHKHVLQSGSAGAKAVKLNKEKKQKELESQDNTSLLLQKLKDRGFISSALTNKMSLPVVDEYLPYGGILEIIDGDENTWSNSVSASCEMTWAKDEVVRAESTVPPRLEELLNPQSHDRRIVGIDKELTSCQKAVRSRTGGTMVYGSKGSGKTAVLKEIAHGLRKDLVHSIWFSCGPNGEKQMQYLKETLRKLFIEAAWYAPSVIIFDDIDKLIPAEQEHRDSSKSAQLAEILKQLATSTMASRKVSLLVSAQAKEAVHGLLISSHLFEDLFHLKSPDKNARELILMEAVRSNGLKTAEGFELLDIAGSTEGYQPSDLWTLVERANHESILRRIQSPNAEFELKNSDFTTAMEGFVPASLRGVKLQKSSVSWDDVGGLKETKSVLLETLEWPTKYAPIFANCPLRLRSGLLLYGYPGCGKTFLASAVAAQCGLNFISIKGPEILNKYIGASEQSVRDLFERAQAAKPCILFFDEFDSIAPKRGHDSTGVTDRVVNQMLTQMDGAEGLDGVYVLAATSRPDLIDSALLRPGRLDKSLICDMPSFEDRVDILKAIQKKMKISPEIKLEDIAARTDGYSPADLQAVLYNAYLDAIHEVVDEKLENDMPSADDKKKSLEFFELSEQLKLDGIPAAEKARMSKKLERLLHNEDHHHHHHNGNADDDEEEEDSTAKVQVHWPHLEKSLSETKPSISTKERFKLQAIYDQFISGRSGNMPDGSASNDIGGRTTLM
ncbi:peroxisomal ATPase Pex1p [Trichomonascus vanleenenianus]|uniref:AAA family ATPase peroxin 1 n=1 Tax=Trichomonascus vanleenenianus TaxID=2268995 RepID=UPI003ECACA11